MLFKDDLYVKKIRYSEGGYYYAIIDLDGSRGEKSSVPARLKY